MQSRSWVPVQNKTPPEARCIRAWASAGGRNYPSVGCQSSRMAAQEAAAGPGSMEPEPGFLKGSPRPGLAKLSKRARAIATAWSEWGKTGVRLRRDQAGRRSFRCLPQATVGTPWGSGVVSLPAQQVNGSYGRVRGPRGDIRVTVEHSIMDQPGVKTKVRILLGILRDAGAGGCVRPVTGLPTASPMGFLGGTALWLGLGQRSVGTAHTCGEGESC